MSALSVDPFKLANVKRLSSANFIVVDTRFLCSINRKSFKLEPAHPPIYHW